MEITTKSRRLRIAAWILGVLTVLPAAVSCGDTATAPSPDAQTQAKENVTVEEAETENPNVAGIRNTLAKLEGKDYGGVDFVIMDRSAEANPNWVAIDVFSEGENGDTINDAVYQRNRALEENLNIHIKDMQEKIPSTTAKKLVTAGDSAFDLMTDGLNDIGSIVSSGCLMNLDDVPGLQLSNPWWDQQMNAELSVAGKHFFCTGDISIMDNYGTWCFMFNKTLAQNYDLPDFYQLVRDGKWTFDAMYDAAKQVAFDLDGNGKMEEDDQWGLYTEDYNNYAFFAAGNEKIIQKDKDDMPILAEY
ncbi:MAG: extracellular solute-binding protein, partial [Clostridia bacterium]|nr:extracellular solute-binding protein [Clostridia bacterium]